MSTVAIVDAIPFTKVFQNEFIFSLLASPIVLSSRFALPPYCFRTCKYINFFHHANNPYDIIPCNNPYAIKLNLDYPHAYPIIPWLRIIPYYPHANLYPIIPMQIYTLLSPCKSIPYYPHANLYPIIPMQIYTLLSPCKSIPYYPHGMITPPFPVLPIFTTLIWN